MIITKSDRWGMRGPQKKSHYWPGAVRSLCGIVDASPIYGSENPEPKDQCGRCAKGWAQRVGPGATKR